MRSSCAVHTCKNQGKHLLPQDPIVRNQWVRALRLDVFKRSLKKYTYICSDHFKPTDFISTPPLFGDQGTIRLRNKSIPSILPWTNHTGVQNPTVPPISPQEDVYLMRQSELLRKTYSKTELPFAFVEEIPFVLSEPSTEKNPLQLDNEKFKLEEYYGDIAVHDHHELCEGTIQSDEDESILSHLQFDNDNKKELTCDDVCDTPLLSSRMYIKSGKDTNFYTGSENYEKVQLVFNSLGKCITKLKSIYGPTPEELPHSSSFYDISYICCIDTKLFK